MENEKEPRWRTRRLGDNRKEVANRPQKIRPGFAQSKDVRESRSIRHKKFSPPRPVVE